MGVKFLSATKNQSKNQSLTSKSSGHCQIMGHMMVQEQIEWLKSISRVRKHRIRAPKRIIFINVLKLKFVFFDFKIRWAWPDHGSCDGSRAKLMSLIDFSYQKNIGLEPKHASQSLI